MQNATFPYLIVDARGDRVASAEHFEDALFWMRTLPSAKAVLRVEDGVELAKRYSTHALTEPRPRWAEA